MNIFLTWKNDGGRPDPQFQSDIFNRDGVSPLACLMMDDGGRACLNTLPWLEEGLARIKLVKEGTADSCDWSRDAWGAQLTLSEVKVYSLYDANYVEIIATHAFEKALISWRDFIQMGPGTSTGISAGISQEISAEMRIEIEE